MIKKLINQASLFKLYKKRQVDKLSSIGFFVPVPIHNWLGRKLSLETHGFILLLDRLYHMNYFGGKMLSLLSELVVFNFIDYFYYVCDPPSSFSFVCCMRPIKATFSLNSFRKI